MKKTGLGFILSSIIVLFYAVIIMYILFAIVKVDTLENFVASIVFEIIGILLLAYFVIGGTIAKTMKTGYYVPMVGITVLYIIILDIIDIVLVATISSTFFILINLVLLFVYCIITFPMYFMGKE